MNEASPMSSSPEAEAAEAPPAASLAEQEDEIEAMKAKLCRLQEEVMEMPRKRRKEAKAEISSLQRALGEKVEGYKSVSASAKESPVARPESTPGARPDPSASPGLTGPELYKQYARDAAAHGRSPGVVRSSLEEELLEDPPARRQPKDIWASVKVEKQLQESEEEINEMKAKLTELQERVMEMPKKERKAAKVEIKRLQS